jgi:hypothetical protein
MQIDKEELIKTQYDSKIKLENHINALESEHWDWEENFKKLQEEFEINTSNSNNSSSDIVIKNNFALVSFIIENRYKINKIDIKSKFKKRDLSILKFAVDINHLKNEILKLSSHNEYFAPISFYHLFLILDELYKAYLYYYLSKAFNSNTNIFRDSLTKLKKEIRNGNKTSKFWYETIKTIFTNNTILNLNNYDNKIYERKIVAGNFKCLLNRDFFNDHFINIGGISDFKKVKYFFPVYKLIDLELQIKGYDHVSKNKSSSENELITLLYNNIFRTNR